MMRGSHAMVFCSDGLVEDTVDACLGFEKLLLRQEKQSVMVVKKRGRGISRGSLIFYLLIWR
jgi:hypothetical protein